MSEHFVFIRNVYLPNIARSNTPGSPTIHQPPLADRFNEAIRWLKNEGKGESVATAARVYSITEEIQTQSLQKKIRRRQKVQSRTTLAKQGTPPLFTKEE